MVGVNYYVIKFLNANINVNLNVITMNILKRILQGIMIINVDSIVTDQDPVVINVIENAINAKTDFAILTMRNVIKL